MPIRGISLDVHRDQDPPSLGGEARFSGADGILAQDEEMVKWLTQCSQEQQSGKRRWDIFEPRRLKIFVTATGNDPLDGGAKSDHDIPAVFDTIEHGYRKIQGASFLAKDAYDVCRFLRSKRAAARE